MLRRIAALLVVFGALCAPAGASTLPPGFAETTVWNGLDAPTVLRFAPDGRVFVATKSGVIQVFDSTSDPTPATFADLRTQVFDGWDRGLLGMALDPGFATGRPYVYVAYAHDKKVPASPTDPRWGDTCPTPPGPTTNGCAITGRLSRLSATGAETVLIEDFCQQFPSHSVGSLEFGPDGQLYMSAGDGASYGLADYGQRGNPCGDPPGPAGIALAPPTAQGGALRAQSFRRPQSQNASLDGAILRLNPDTGEASSDNPAAGNPDPNRRRIVAYGFRNPFRFTFRPGTGEIWSGDVGWNAHEEINRTQNVAQVRNYGWPCYEGGARMLSYDNQNLASCETLYGTGGVTQPYFTYGHLQHVVEGESCPVSSSSISGLYFYAGSQFPDRYRGALFFSDYARSCIWVAFKGADGLPDMATRVPFATDAGGPVWLTGGPDGALYYVDVWDGAIRRVAAFNQAPTARIVATPRSGAAPLTVELDASTSTDPENEPLTYAWDLDGDGAYDDSTDDDPSYTFTTRGPKTVRLRVSDTGDRTGFASETITVGERPSATIDAPSGSRTWSVGDTIDFTGSARRGDGTALPASALTWALELRHCGRTAPDACHTHDVEDYAGVRSGSFVAPDHEYPAHLLLSLTAVDEDGLRATETVRLDPRTADVTLASEPPGIPLSLGSETQPAPFTHTLIARSTSSIAAATPLGFQDATFGFTRWSDGLAPAHEITAPDGGTAAYTATYARPPRTNLAGAEIVGDGTATAEPGYGAIYYMAAGRAGTAATLRLYLDASSTASRVVLALYSDAGANPGTRLATGVVTNPVAGAWNPATLPAGVQLIAGRRYWLALLNPPDSTGVLAWRDRAGGRELGQTTAAEGIAELPETWQTAPGHWHVDGHVSGGAWEAEPEEPTPSPSPIPTAAPAPRPPEVDPPPIPDHPAPVGAWGFDETAGAIAADASGSRNAGTLDGPRRVAGRYGRALSFDGRDDWVTVTDSPSLDVATAITVEGWVYPTRRGGWRTLAVKETGRGLAWGLYGRPAGHASTAAERWAAGAPAPPLQSWTHLAMTYDGRAIRTYVNGLLAATRAQSGRLQTSAQPLRFGGNAVWREWFAGRLDELRVYDRALTAAQIQADMQRPIANPVRGRGKTGTGAKIGRYRGRHPHGGQSPRARRPPK